MKEYYYVDSHRVRKGPYVLDVLVRQEDFNDETLVWCAGMRSWARVKDVSEVAAMYDKWLTNPLEFVNEEVAEQPTSNVEDTVEEMSADSIDDSPEKGVDEVIEEVDNDSTEEYVVEESVGNNSTVEEIQESAPYESLNPQEEIIDTQAEETVGSEVEEETEMTNEDLDGDGEEVAAENEYEESKVVVPPPYIPQNTGAANATGNTNGTVQSKSGNKAGLYVLLGFLLAMLLTGILFLCLFFSGVIGHRTNNDSSNHAGLSDVASYLSESEAVDTALCDYNLYNDEQDDDNYQDYEDGNGYYSGTLHVSGNISGWGCYELYVNGSSGWVSSCNSNSRGPIRVDRYDSDDGYLVVSALNNGEVVGTYTGYVIGNMYSGVFTNSSGKSGDFYME